ncbi:MAG TPA: complex I NDUFA9 subunit family protein [Xanthobacteraceae bacterium]|nr:complex I NDUFA9 subunit family protein [Xanthobacteraceae bacterium]
MTVQSNYDTLITVFGGSGFVGRHVVRALAQQHYRIRVAVRRPELAFHLQPLGRVGQIHAVQANVRHAGSVAAAVHDAHAVVNLVGILYARGRQRFDAVHTAGAETVARAAAQEGARLVHMSALGVDRNERSAYARSKLAGEKAVLAAVPSATILRPSVVFGPEDDFLNRFAALARFSPMLPLIGGGHTKFQPVFAGDVGAAVAAAVAGETTPGAIYELGGPEVCTLKAIMQYVLKTIERRRLLMPLPFWAAKLEAVFLQMLPTPLLTPDQVELLRTDNVVSEAAAREQRTLRGLGITPESMQAIVPAYLWRFRRAGQFRTLRHG